jgi:hypothetical protein
LNKALLQHKYEPIECPLVIVNQLMMIASSFYTLRHIRVDFHETRLYERFHRLWRLEMIVWWSCRVFQLLT